MTLSLLFFTTLVFPVSASFASVCKFSADLSKAKVEWTAFKTTAKIPVTATFKTVTIKGKSEAKNMKALIQSWKATIDLDSIETENPARNATILETFFKKLRKPEITGTISKFKGYEQGTFDLNIKMGGEKKSIPMEFTFEVEKEKESRVHRMVAIGELNIHDFKAGAALEALNKACFDLHKGPDGISKTWDDVKLRLSIPLDKDCK